MMLRCCTGLLPMFCTAILQAIFVVPLQCAASAPLPCPNQTSMVAGLHTCSPSLHDAVSGSVETNLAVQLGCNVCHADSGVVVSCEDAPRGAALLFLRGAPGVIRSMVRDDSVPADFDNVCTTTLSLCAHCSDDSLQSRPFLSAVACC